MSSSKDNCQNQHRDYIFTFWHFTFWLITANLLKSYSSFDMYLGHKVFRVQSVLIQSWKVCSKTQWTKLTLPLARHLLYSSLKGLQEISRPLCPRNRLKVDAYSEKLASKDKPVTKLSPTINYASSLYGSDGPGQTRHLADEHTRSFRLGPFMIRTDGLPQNTFLPLQCSSIYMTTLFYFYQHMCGVVEERVMKGCLTSKSTDTPADRQVCATAAVLPASWLVLVLLFTS